ncbi:UDP-N-acetylglucosamine--N-acetylmuramyl-(pentapeptide) pyrophosphoryl-undecaprenol N-acetylglucosamine transferase [Candidatus Burarchaeum australiense]|nr:UDP-N-acetylglucosamine--N-acetylmuramyl-(pentapeptide) pyrophosphoryl-undecaprenol N-acetylglucosamine transferase [Candidatus Burarchaeum australiense]
MHVFLSACGEGFGHSSRMAAALAGLRAAGHEGVIATYGKAFERLKKMGYPVFETKPEVSMTGKGGKLDVLRSVVASSSGPKHVLEAMALEMRKMKAMNARVVISDSRLSTVLAGRRLGLPTFFVCNQTSYNEKLHVPSDLEDFEESTIGRLMSAPLAIPLQFANLILIPDFAPPNTIALPLLSRQRRVEMKTTFLGPLSLATVVKSGQAHWPSSKPRVLVTMGGQAFRKGEYEALRKSLVKNQHFDFLVSSFFVEKDENIGSVKFRRFLPDLLPYMRAADFQMMPAGHSGIMESMVLGKPALLLPDAAQPEQLANARRYKQLGLGDYIEVKNLPKIGDALSRLSRNHRKYDKALNRISVLAMGEMNGAKNIVKLCEEYARRMSY